MKLFTRRVEDRVAFVAILGYLLIVITADVVTPPTVNLQVYAALAALAASVLCTYPQTVVVGVTGVVLTVLDDAVAPNEGSAFNRLGAILAVVVIVAASIAVARLRRDEKQLHEHVRETGEAAQRALLRPLPLRTRDMLVDGFYAASRREALIGGDVYEAVDTPYGTRVIIGDVRGKGLSTLGAGAAVLTAFREAAYHRPDLAGAVAAMEQGLLRYHRSREHQAGLWPDAPPADVTTRAAEEFVTALVFATEEEPVASPAEGDAVPVVFVDCGHTAPILIGADGTVRELDWADPGLPLGLGDLVGTPRRAYRILAPPGFRILACTDGVTEARSPDGSFYPLAQRLTQWATLPTPELLQRLREDLHTHTGGRFQDDMAVLVIQQQTDLSTTTQGG